MKRSLPAGAVLAVTLAAGQAADFAGIVKRADAARDAGNIEKAAPLYQRALRLQPAWKQGWWVLGSIFYDTSRYQDGAEAFLRLSRLDPDKSAGWAMAGLCEFETQHYVDALAHLQKADKLGLPPALYDAAQYHLALIFIRDSEFDQALERISRYASRGEENPKMAEAMGIAALRKPILPAGIAPEDRDLILRLGKAMTDAAASRGKDATAQFDAILADYPAVPQLHYLYGLVLLQSDPERAVAAWRQELALSPGHPQALVSLAAEYAKRGEYETALPFAEKAVAAQPGYYAAHTTLGKVLVEGDLDAPRGMKELETAVAMAPQNPQSRLALATAYAKAGRKSDAAAQRAEFLRLRTQIDANAAVRK